MTQDEIIEQKNKLYTEKKNLESKLNSDDYKTIKNAEAQAAGLTLPYNPDELHVKHQAWRDRINAIEDESERLDTIETETEDVPSIESEAESE